MHAACRMFHCVSLEHRLSLPMMPYHDEKLGYYTGIITAQSETHGQLKILSRLTRFIIAANIHNNLTPKHNGGVPDGTFSYQQWAYKGSIVVQLSGPVPRPVAAEVD